MIIDVHRHMWSADQRHPETFAGDPRWAGSEPSDFDWRRAAREIVEEMDGASVDVSVIIVADFAKRFGEPSVSIEEENEMLVSAQEMYPERLIAFYGIDPQRPEAAKKFEAAVKAGKVSGIKLHPTTGYYPGDKSCYELYEICAANGLPVLFHSGPGFHPLLIGKSAHPLEFDRVAADFPKVDMILGHAGGDWWEDCIVVAKAHPNLYLEISEWQAKFKSDGEGTVRAVDKMIRGVGAERVMWASDFPGIRKEMSLKAYVELCQELPYMGKKYGCDISEEAVGMMMGGNASRVLGVG